MANGTFLYPSLIKKLGDAADTNEKIEQIEQELQTFAKLGLANNFTAKNTFRDEVIILGDKSLKLGWEDNDIKFEIYQETLTKNIILKALQGDLKLEAGPSNNILVSNKRIGTVADPNHELDAANKRYVDSKIGYREVAGGFRFNRQVIEANKVTKYYASRTYTNMNLPSSAKVISCNLKTIPASGEHLVLTFFTAQPSGQITIEVYQYNSNSDITSQLQNATYCLSWTI